MKIELDDGFAFGRGSFETIKVVKRQPLFLKDHLQRLEGSLKFFAIDRAIDENDLKEIDDFIKKTDEDDFALKIMVSEKNFIMSKRPDIYKNSNKSFSLKISPARKTSTSKMVHHKSLAYYENILEHKIAVEEGFDSCLFLNERDEITETAFANIFFVKDGEIFTPPISSGLLRGTMREYLIKNYKIIEKEIPLEQIKIFDEAFISNALMGVRNVWAIDQIKFSSNNKTQTIQEDLKKLGF